MATKLLSGVVHSVPADVRKAITSSDAKITAWNNLTPLGRNEWICWVTAFKKAETRKQHIERLQSDLLKGKKRPCCWPGCKHR